MSKNKRRKPILVCVKINYWPVTVLAKVLIVASAAAVDADIVVELIVDDAVAVDDETAIHEEERKKWKYIMEILQV